MRNGRWNAMSKTKIVLNSTGVRALLKSNEIANVCDEIASNVLARCGDGYERDSYIGKNRVNAMVYASTYQAKKDNLENNTLLKAVSSK